jgi:Icc-related predicted phosphoesterase
MKIHSISDLHTEGSVYMHDLPDADVCVLAGDITVVRHLLTDNSAGYSGNEFLSRVNEKYKKTFYVMGNHEFYRGDLDTATDLLYKHFHKNYPNIEILNKSTVFYEGITFLGCTLWTDYDKGNPFTMMQAMQYMSDFNCITKSGEPLTSQMCYDKHKQHRNFLQSKIKAHSNNPKNKVVVITHHLPSLQCIDPKFLGSHMNGAFVSDLDYMMTDQVKLWIAGHTHSSHDVMIGGTRVLINPKGYGCENPDFNPSLVVEV